MRDLSGLADIDAWGLALWLSRAEAGKYFYRIISPRLVNTFSIRLFNREVFPPLVGVPVSGQPTEVLVFLSLVAGLAVR